MVTFRTNSSHPALKSQNVSHWEMSIPSLNLGNRLKDRPVTDRNRMKSLLGKPCEGF